MKKKKVCVITGMRSDYGHLYWILKAIKNHKKLQLQIIATGGHLSKRYGATYKEILSDGFKIDKKVDILKYSDSQLGVTKSIGDGCKGFAEAYRQLKPDVVLILGDRYEMFAAAIAAHVANIPIAHIHGGETSQGAIDEAIRHSITKMAQTHFAATTQYRNRIIQMGEQPRNVFNYGAPGLDSVFHNHFMGKDELEKNLKFVLGTDVALVTYHPVTLDKMPPEKQAQNILRAIEQSGLRAIFTQSNADPNGMSITKAFKQFCRRGGGRYKYVDNLGQENFLNCIKHCGMMIGNSSSGLIEAPSFRLPVINIGDRQKGRMKAKNVIDTDYSTASILKGIQMARSSRFREGLKRMRNPYVRFKNGTASQKIVEKLSEIDLSTTTVKPFYDLQLN